MKEENLRMRLSYQVCTVHHFMIINLGEKNAEQIGPGVTNYQVHLMIWG